MSSALLPSGSQKRTFLIGALLNAVGGGLTMPILVVYLNQVVGLGLATSSLVLSWTAVTGMVTAPIVGALVDRVGPRPVLLAGILIKASGMLAWAGVTNTRQAFLVTTLAAVGDAGIWAPQTTMMARMVPAPDRQRFFGLQFMMLNLGLGVGGVVSSFIVDIDDRASFSRLFMLDAASYLVFLAFILSLRGIGGRLSDEERGARHSGSYREVFADRRLVRLTVMSVVMLVCGYASVDAGVPAMLTTVGGLDVNQLGPMWAVNTSVIVLLQLVMLNRIAGHSRTRMLALMCALWAVSWFINAVGISIPSATFAMACVATAIFAVGETIWSPVGAALANDLAPEHLRGRYNAMGAMAWVVAGTVGPALSGVMLEFGLVYEWIGLLICLLGVTAMLALQLGRQLTPAEDGRVREVSAHTP